MSEWQPIETAPDAEKEKTVWLFGGRYDEPTLRPSDGSFWRYEKSIGSEHVPTHWMELKIPESPK